MTRWLSFAAVLLPALLCSIGCGTPSSSVEGAITFDPCTPLAIAPDGEASADQRQGVADAVAMWNARAGAALAMAADATASPVVPVHFQSAAAPFHGLYEARAGEIFINDDLLGHQRIVTIAHELGHAFGLVHISTDLRPSVMNGGNLSVEPTPEDVASLTALWGKCSSL